MHSEILHFLSLIVLVVVLLVGESFCMDALAQAGAELLAQALDLVVDPVQQGGVALAHSGGDGILAAQRGDAHRVAGVLLCKSDDLGVVVGPCSAIAVFQRVLGGRIGIILLQGNVGIFLGQVGLGGGVWSLEKVPVLRREFL